MGFKRIFAKNFYTNSMLNYLTRRASGKTLSKRIYLARKEKKMSLRALSKEMNLAVSFRELWAFERGLKEPSSVIVEKIAIALHKPTYWFYVSGNKNQSNYEKQTSK